MEEFSLKQGAPEVLLIGSDKAHQSSLAKKLKEQFQDWTLKVHSFQSPNELKAGLKKFEKSDLAVILLLSEKIPPPMTGWKAVLALLKNPISYILVSEQPVLENLKKDLQPKVIIQGANSSFDEIRSFFSDKPQGTLSQVAASLGDVSIENSSALSGSLLEEVAPADSIKLVTDTKIDPPSQGDLSSLLESASNSSRPLETLGALAEVSKAGDLSDPSLSLNSAPDLSNPAVAINSPSDATSPSASLTGTEMGSGVDLDAQIAHSLGAGTGIDNLLPNSVISSPDELVLGNADAVSAISPSHGTHSAAFDDLAASLDAGVSKAKNKAGHDLKEEESHPQEISRVPSSKRIDDDVSAVHKLTENASRNDSLVTGHKDEKDLSAFAEDLGESPNLNFAFESGPASGNDSSTIQILKKYAALKEKEIKEKDSTIESLKKQLRQTEEKLRRSDEQRRKVTLEHEETIIKVRTLESQIEQEKHMKSKLEQDHQEQLKDYKLRFENAEFQARRLEKKLEDFRDRIKNDIQQIRHRERELANRLELQKRDAEALIASKDERLLLQKREIDRLEFEIDSLRDRIVEDTQKSEERAQKLIRALQSLKLAQGVLSGIDEEVLPSAAAKVKGKASGEAA